MTEKKDEIPIIASFSRLMQGVSAAARLANSSFQLSEQLRSASSVSYPVGLSRIIADRWDKEEMRKSLFELSAAARLANSSFQLRERLRSASGAVAISYPSGFSRIISEIWDREETRKSLLNISAAVKLADAFSSFLEKESEFSESIMETTSNLELTCPVSDEIVSAVRSFISGIKDSDFVDTFYDRIKNVSKRAGAAFVWFLLGSIWTLFLNVYSNLVTPYAEQYINEKDPKSTKELKQQLKEVRAEVDFASFINYKVVTINGLIVRQKSSKKSARIGSLQIGKIVRVIQKRRNWSLVEISLSDNLDDSLVGWVFTRYLTPLSK